MEETRNMVVFEQGKGLVKKDVPVKHLSWGFACRGHDPIKFITVTEEEQDTMIMNVKGCPECGGPLEPYMMYCPPTKQLNFSQALESLKTGSKIARAGWNGKGMWIRLRAPDSLSDMTAPYIYMYTATKDTVPWLASQTDILAEDWMVVP